MLSAVQGPCHSPANILLQTLDKLIHNRLHQQARRILGFLGNLPFQGQRVPTSCISGLTVARTSGSNSDCFQPFRSMASFWIMDTTSSGKKERTSPATAQAGADFPCPARRPDRTSGFRPAVRIIINRGQRAVHNHLFLRQLYASPGL